MSRFYTHTHTHTHTHTPTRTHTYIHTHIHTYTRTHTHQQIIYVITAMLSPISMFSNEKFLCENEKYFPHADFKHSSSHLREKN